MKNTYFRILFKYIVINLNKYLFKDTILFQGLIFK